MSFGGAFAPNRFERVSTLVAAWIPRKQAAFDASRPPPTGGPPMDAAPSGGAAHRRPATGRTTRGAAIHSSLY
eukprot:3043627-Pleurochrysis_carterae.AAC.1